jgi:hypothetical protein
VSFLLPFLPDECPEPPTLLPGRHDKENCMRKKRREPCEETIPVAARGRVLARTLAESLLDIRGGEELQLELAATRTSPPPGYDVTYVGSDSI